MSSETIIELYERHARDFDRDRGRLLREKGWLDRFLSHVPRSGSVLDAGCGMGEPIARYMIGAGRQVVGIDSSPSLIRLCRSRFPASEWIVADMRQLALGRRFDGILAWDSLFHLGMDHQRAMIARFAAHASPGAPLMFTSGPRHGEAVGTVWGEPLYHASLDSAEYERILSTNGFSVLSHLVEDPDCGRHTIWLAKFSSNRPDAT